MSIILDFELDQAYLWPKLWVDAHSHPLHPPRHPPDILQTPCRYPSATLLKCWDGALGDRTVDLYNSLFVVCCGMALCWLLIYQSFNYILQRYPPDTSRHHPDNLPNFSKNPGSSWEDTAEDWCHYLGLCRSSLWPRLWLDTHSQPLNTPRHSLDIIQTPCRHHSATLHQVFGWSSGRKDCRLI